MQTRASLRRSICAFCEFGGGTSGCRSQGGRRAATHEVSPPNPSRPSRIRRQVGRDGRFPGEPLAASEGSVAQGVPHLHLPRQLRINRQERELYCLSNGCVVRAFSSGCQILTNGPIRVPFPHASHERITTSPRIVPTVSSPRHSGQGLCRKVVSTKLNAARTWLASTFLLNQPMWAAAPSNPSWALPGFTGCARVRRRPTPSRRPASPLRWREGHRTRRS